MRLSNKELEVLAYLNNDPIHKVYAELEDSEQRIEELEQQVESLELDLEYHERNQ